MPKAVTFVNKFLKRLDRMDRQAVQDYVASLFQEIGVYEEMLQHVPEAVLLTDEDGTVRWMNGQAGRWFGGSEAARRKIREVIKEEALSCWIEKQLAGLNQKLTKDFQILTPREMTVRVSLAPLSASAGRQHAVFVSDLSGRGDDLRDDAQAARIGALVQLAAGIAHEIGNPLNSLSIHLSLLKKDIQGLSDPKKRNMEKTLDVLFSETSRLDRIVKNFLKATRRPPLRFRQEDVNDIAREAVDLMRPELEAASIRLDFRPERLLPPFLMDRERMHQVFINLIKNAREAMPRGGRLLIAITFREKIAIVTVKDEGSGIPEAQIPRIFEAYYTTKEEGSGLGLMTVFNAVKEHGGRIEVSSKVGKGTTFTLLLPVRQAKLQLPQYKVR